MKKKGKILIISPHLDDLGGTELETLITAQVFLEKGLADSIVVFSPQKASVRIQSFVNEKRISYQYYPDYINNKYFLKIDYFLIRLFSINYSSTRYLYWFLKSIFCKYDFIYVISSSVQEFYFPIVINFNLKKVIIKFTYGFDRANWNKWQVKIFNQCSVLLVTAHSQKLFLKEKFQVNNIKVVDVFIWNEDRLKQISVVKSERFIFGMLCRISKEKGIEDALQLIKNFQNLGYNVNLVITGPSYEKKYLVYLSDLIVSLNLKEHVTLETKPLNPSQVPDFYKQINAFLITSIGEGGPNTGLECMAAGIPVLSYDIGAMHERLEPFKDLFIAKDYEDLLEKAVFLLNLNIEDYQNLGKRLKKHYKEGYTNELKLSKTLQLLNNVKQ